ncbi:hypothetical protein HY988_05410 [Candidatus Micrarchaeota archaeon]|nr:hypothetical protein [Candidatus Micrarchaeota archaeon]
MVYLHRRSLGPFYNREPTPAAERRYVQATGCSPLVSLSTPGSLIERLRSTDREIMRAAVQSIGSSRVLASLFEGQIPLDVKIAAADRATDILFRDNCSNLELKIALYASRPLDRLRAIRKIHQHIRKGQDDLNWLACAVSVTGCGDGIDSPHYIDTRRRFLRILREEMDTVQPTALDLYATNVPPKLAWRAFRRMLQLFDKRQESGVDASLALIATNEKCPTAMRSAAIRKLCRNPDKVSDRLAAVVVALHHPKATARLAAVRGFDNNFSTNDTNELLDLIDKSADPKICAEAIRVMERNVDKISSTHYGALAVVAIHAKNETNALKAAKKLEASECQDHPKEIERERVRVINETRHPAVRDQINVFLQEVYRARIGSEGTHLHQELNGN